MKVLVVGSGGREHALAWKLAQSPRISRTFVAPGNAGTAAEPGCVNVDLTDIPDLLAFARTERVAFTVVGPEAPLAAGIVDQFRAADQRIFGPVQAAARLESSKSFAKAFMARHGIPSAAYASFDDAGAAYTEYLADAAQRARIGQLEDAGQKPARDIRSLGRQERFARGLPCGVAVADIGRKMRLGACQPLQLRH